MWGKYFANWATSQPGKLSTASFTPRVILSNVPQIVMLELCSPFSLTQLNVLYIHPHRFIGLPPPTPFLCSCQGSSPSITRRFLPFPSVWGNCAHSCALILRHSERVKEEDLRCSVLYLHSKAASAMSVGPSVAHLDMDRMEQASEVVSQVTHTQTYAPRSPRLTYITAPSQEIIFKLGNAIAETPKKGQVPFFVCLFCFLVCCCLFLKLASLNINSEIL